MNTCYKQAWHNSEVAGPSQSSAATSGPTVLNLLTPKTRQAKLSASLQHLDREFPYSIDHDLGPSVHWKGNMTSPMHRWLRYREAYSPDLIDKLQLGKRILDPFSGCGSIPIGSATRNRTSLGIDLNPIATFSSKVKLTPLSPEQLAKALTFCQNIPKIVSQYRPFDLPGLSISEKVFEPEILDVVQRTRTALEDAFVDDRDLRDFVFLGWLSVLEKVGSYFKEGNGIKYRNKKRQKGRYEDRPDGEWQQARFGDDQLSFYFSVFQDQLTMMMQDATCWRNGTWGDQAVVAGTAFDLQKISGSRTFDSIIFSPPYANRFDYFESFKVELWFGSFVESYEDLTRLRKASLRSHLAADFKRAIDEFEPLEEFISIMDRDASSWRMGVADLLRGYFHDVKIVLEQCRAVLNGGRCYVVVGNSAFASVIVPTDILTAIVGRQAGFKEAKIIETRHLTVAPQQRNQLKGFEPYMRESIVVLQ